MVAAADTLHIAILVLDLLARDGIAAVTLLPAITVNSDSDLIQIKRLLFQPGHLVPLGRAGRLTLCSCHLRVVRRVAGKTAEEGILVASLQSPLGRARVGVGVDVDAPSRAA